MSRAFLLTILMICFPSSLSSQERGELYFAAQENSSDSSLSSGQRNIFIASDEVDGCDNDFDGALWGTLIGLSPVAVAILTTDNPGDEAAGTLVLGIIGGIAGFWIGLAVDSASCKPQES